MKKLASLRALAIVGVVAPHAATWGAFALTYWVGRLGEEVTGPDWRWVGSLTYYEVMTVKQLALLSVPIFLFASGWYVVYAARGKASNLTSSLVWGQQKSLITPFLIWMLISTVLFGLEQWLRLGSSDTDLATFILQRLWDYYYIPVLAQLLLFSPILVWAAIRHPVVLVVSTCLLTFSASALHYLAYTTITVPAPLASLREWTQFIVPSWVLYYSLGILAARYSERLQRRLVGSRRLLIVAAVVFGVGSILEAAWLNRVDQMYYIGHHWQLSTVLYATVSVLLLSSYEIHRGRCGRILDRLGAKSYGIYLVQPLAIRFAATATHRFVPQLLPVQALLQPMLIVAGFACPLVIMWVVRRSPIRKYRRHLFG